MGTKNKPGKFDCYANAENDEPMFILLGRDPSAAWLVREWARKRADAIRWKTKPETDAMMVVEALICADDMESFARRWHERKQKETSAEIAHASTERGEAHPTPPKERR